MSSRDEKQRRRALAEMAEKSREPQFSTRPGVDCWADVLEELNAIVLPVVRRHEQKIRKFPGVFEEALVLLDSGGMLQQPADDSDIASAGARLGVRLPPSYADFLSVSNGLLLPRYCKFSSADELLMYPQADPFGAELLDEHFGDLKGPSDEQYENYDQVGDFCFRAAYARTSVALNGPVPGGRVAAKEFGWIMLVTEVGFDSGELEIWEHGSWHNRRYRSFAEYFGQARKTIVDSLRFFAV